MGSRYPWRTPPCTSHWQPCSYSPTGLWRSPVLAPYPATRARVKDLLTNRIVLSQVRRFATKFWLWNCSSKTGLNTNSERYNFKWMVKLIVLFAWGGICPNRAKSHPNMDRNFLIYLKAKPCYHYQTLKQSGAYSNFKHSFVKKFWS